MPGEDTSGAEVAEWQARQPQSRRGFGGPFDVPPRAQQARGECHLQTHTPSGGKGVAEASARQRCTVSSRAARLGGNPWGTPLGGWAAGVSRKPRPPVSVRRIHTCRVVYA